MVQLIFALFILFTSTAFSASLIEIAEKNISSKNDLAIQLLNISKINKINEKEIIDQCEKGISAACREMLPTYLLGSDKDSFNKKINIINFFSKDCIKQMNYNSCFNVFNHIIAYPNIKMDYIDQKYLKVIDKYNENYSLHADSRYLKTIETKCENRNFESCLELSFLLTKNYPCDTKDSLFCKNVHKNERQDLCKLKLEKYCLFNAFSEKNFQTIQQYCDESLNKYVKTSACAFLYQNKVQNVKYEQYYEYNCMNYLAGECLSDITLSNYSKYTNNLKIGCSTLFEKNGKCEEIRKKITPVEMFEIRCAARLSEIDCMAMLKLKFNNNAEVLKAKMEEICINGFSFACLELAKIYINSKNITKSIIALESACNKEYYDRDTCIYLLAVERVNGTVESTNLLLGKVSELGILGPINEETKKQNSEWLENNYKKKYELLLSGIDEYINRSI